MDQFRGNTGISWRPLRILGGVTMIELLVVLAIIAILATIAVGQYEGSVTRAKIAGAFAEVRQIEQACERYRLDVGQYPPSSSSGTWTVGATALAQDPTGTGCGFMTLVLQHSLSGNASAPIDPRWKGPYLNLDREQFGDLQSNPITATTPLAMIQILDPWGNPYRYLRFDDYLAMGGTELPATDPFAATERWYNVNTIQIVSQGPNGTTLAPPQYGLDTQGDDVTNFTRSGR